MREPTPNGAHAASSAEWESEHGVARKQTFAWALHMTAYTSACGPCTLHITGQHTHLRAVMRVQALTAPALSDFASAATAMWTRLCGRSA